MLLPLPNARRKLDSLPLIEHSRVVAPEDYKRFRGLGLIASMQPNHLLTNHELGGKRNNRLCASKAHFPFLTPWQEFLE